MKNFSYSIGIVDYLGRFEEYFKPLILSLVKVFPDKEIICVLNGHYDKMAQIKYIREASIFLSKFPNIRYYSFDDHQSLSKCWNRIILMSLTSGTLILNDDVMVDPYFRVSFENNLSKENNFFVINKSWSHFFISKEIIKVIGWFEERLLGIGWEDGDFMLRMVEKNIKPLSLECLGIKNFVAPAKNAGFTSISKFIGKYSEINKDFFNQKWHFNHSDIEFGAENKKYKINFYWNNQFLSGQLKDGMDTPDFYTLELLKDNIKNINYNYKNDLKIYYYKFKNIILKKFKNIVKLLLKK